MPDYVPGRVTVVFRGSFNCADNDEFNKRYAGQIIRSTYIPGVNIARMTVPEGEEEQIVNTFKADSDVFDAYRPKPAPPPVINRPLIRD